ncbi:hypothetical protein VSR82_07735 [Burkholderia sp. JPY481]
MNDEKKQVAVELTAGEVQRIDERAQKQGISTPDFMAYCVRALSFGINYAIGMLPNQGQAGTDKSE